MLEERVYNHGLAWAPPQSSGASHLGLMEMLDHYSPFGQIRNVLCSFRSGVGMGGYQGSAAPLSLDHVFRRITGMGALKVGLDREIYGGGKGLVLADSVASSLGEAVERMLGAFSSLEPAFLSTSVTATAQQMRDRGYQIVGPEDFEMFTDEQLATVGFRCVPWTPDTRLTWHRGTNLLTGAEHWVPGQLVHLFYVPEGPEDHIGASSSGGLATHYDDEHALCHALLEVVERDALNLAWFCKVPLTRIELDEPFEDPEITRFMASVARAGMKVDFYLHRLDMPEFFVVTASAVEPGLEAHSYVSGGGVGVNIEHAMRSALAEVVQAERMVRSPSVAPRWELTGGFKRRFTVDRAARPDEFTNFIQVVDYYGFAENQQKLDWFLRDPDLPRLGLSELRTEPTDSELERILSLYRKYSLTPIAFDFTPDTFSQVRLRKVFVPELTPAFPPNIPLLGHRRYRELRMKLGLDDREWTLADMPADPLPYP
ncbi:MAG: YcaO-like family protein [Propionicimonas sp.]